MKTCSTCKQPKPLEDFARDKIRKDGRTHNCKKCRSIIYKKWMIDNPEKHKETQDRYAPYRQEYYQRPDVKLKHRKKHIERKYGISYEQYEKMVDLQRNLCYVCNEPEPQERNSHLAVDHNHKTGQIRKLLCSKCNTAVGLLKENANLIEKLKQYIIEHEKYPAIDSK